MSPHQPAPPDPSHQPDAERITAASKSNLAFTFFCLPADRRRDMAVFYAFCRLADDISDQPGVATSDRLARLEALRSWIDGKKAASGQPEPELAGRLRDVIARRGIEPARLHAILDGVARDIDPKPFATFQELLGYCHLVASEVGLVSIGIFGCRHPDSATYAVQLGYALQLTNILRDVGEDYANGGRVYLPIEDLDRFGIKTDELVRCEGTRPFRELMEMESARAKGFFRASAEALPEADRRSLVAAEIMSAIYSRLLCTMHADGFRVVTRRYSLGLTAKLVCAVGVLIRGRSRCTFTD